MPIISNNAVVGNKYKTHFDYLRNFCFIIAHIYIICNFWSFAVTLTRLHLLCNHRLSFGSLLYLRPICKPAAHSHAISTTQYCVEFVVACRSHTTSMLPHAVLTLLVLLVPMA